MALRALAQMSLIVILGLDPASPLIFPLSALLLDGTSSVSIRAEETEGSALTRCKVRVTYIWIRSEVRNVLKPLDGAVDPSLSPV